MLNEKFPRLQGSFQFFFLKKCISMGAFLGIHVYKIKAVTIIFNIQMLGKIKTKQRVLKANTKYNSVFIIYLLLLLSYICTPPSLRRAI